MQQVVEAIQSFRALRASQTAVASSSISLCRCLSKVVGQSMQVQLAIGVTRMFDKLDLLREFDEFEEERADLVTAKVLASSKQRLQELHFCASDKEHCCVRLRRFMADARAVTGYLRQSLQIAARPWPLAVHFLPHNEHLSLPKKFDIIMVLCFDLVEGQK